MTSKSQEPLTRPDKPVVINSDVKAFEALHGPVLRDWSSYHIHDLIAWYAWHAPADGVRGQEVRLAGSRTAVALGAKDKERLERLARMCTAQAVTRCFGPRFSPQSLLFKQLDRTHPAERRGLRLLRRAECAFPSHHRPGGTGPNRPPACGALWKVAQLGKRARATPRQAAGGGCARVRRPRFGARLHGKAQSGQRASLMARPGPGRAPSGCQLWAKEVSRTQDYG